MIYVGIDVVKDKHDCLSPTLMEKCYLKHLPSPTTSDDFNELHQKIASCYG